MPRKAERVSVPSESKLAAVRPIVKTVRSLIDWRPFLKLFGGHKTRRAKHASHPVDKGTLSIPIQIYDMYILAGKVIDQTAVIEVPRNPSSLAQLMMEFEDHLQRVQNL